jgi:trk system potassium uptake protein TrkH
MSTLKPILLVIGILLSTLGCTMMLPALYDLKIGSPDWVVFAASSTFTRYT